MHGEHKMIQLKQIIMVIFVLAIVGCADVQQADQWDYSRERDSKLPNFKSFAATSASMESIGFAVGGAMDINNFRENIENGYMPLPSDITYEGLFYDYYFDTGSTSCTELFCPVYSYAVSQDPFSGEEKEYLAVGLHSGLSEVGRKQLNLVVVLDISGSMSSPFNSYYYDQFGNDQKIDVESKSKLEVATESIVAMLDHLSPEDKLSIVLFDDEGFLAKPLHGVGETNMDELKKHLLAIEPAGGTTMAAGMQLATEELASLGLNPDVYENRIIFLTDAMPNLGEISEDGLFGMTQNNAAQGIYTSFIGIGIDFDTELIEEITKIRGANYFSVHNAEEFQQRLDEEFDFMVTPLVFNVQLQLQAEGYDIIYVYGSPEADEATGELLFVNTLFPSAQVDGAVNGGVILVQLEKVSDDKELELVVSYEDRSGNLATTTTSFAFPTEIAEFFENTGIQKSILLTRYVNLMKQWLTDERATLPIPVLEHTGIMPPDYILGEWERQSVPLTISVEYQRYFEEFFTYFTAEMESLGDETLQQEVDILELLK
jgi:Ca-activated chloride channel homolog